MKKSRIGSQCAFGDHDLCAMPQSCACQCHRGPAVSDEANIDWMTEAVGAFRSAVFESTNTRLAGSQVRLGLRAAAPTIREQAIRTTAEPLAKWIEENVAGSQVMRRDDGDWFVVT